jgi:drug/metabolite transporter (DMT)-like permease
MPTVTAPDQSEASTLRAIAAMLASQASFTINDMLIKLAAAEIPGGQAIFMRGICVTVLALSLGVALGGIGPLPGKREARLIGWRSVGEVVGTFLYLSALFRMPIADATAILQFLPLAITAGAALFLGEPVGWRRWSATLVGFAGVMIVIRPGTSAFNPWSLLALSAIGFMVLRDLATRRIGTHVPTLLIATISGIVITVASTGFLLVETWVWPGSKAVALTTAASIFVLGGYYWIIDAMRQGNVAIVATFRYSVILWALLAGILVFGEWPDGIDLLGTGIVIAAGLYTFMRERIRARERGKA